MGASLVVVLSAAAVALTVVGVNSVATSTAGETIDVDGRPVVVLPDVDNTALAVVDADGRLASVVIATLLPAGLGGSIVTIPVNADANGGLEPTARPLDSIIDLDDPTAFFESIENTVGVSLRFGEIVSAARLGELLEPVMPVDVVLNADVVDGIVGDLTTLVPAGDNELDTAEMAAALAAVDRSVSASETHGNDVALWSALAAASPGDDAVDAATATEVATVDDLFARLWSGDVQVRDLRTDAGLTFDDDAVVLSRRDAVVVFAQISPTRVAAPEPGLIYRVIVPFTDEQIEAGGGVFTSNTQIARTVVGEMLFFQNNVISVDTAPAVGGAPELTRIDVADDTLVQALQDSAFVIYGDAEAVWADEVVEGVDAVITLGTAYFDHKSDADVSAADSEPVAGDVDDAATVGAEGDGND